MKKHRRARSFSNEAVGERTVKSHLQAVLAYFAEIASDLKK